MEWVPVFLVTFKLIVFGTGMFFAIKWHYDREQEEKAKKEKHPRKTILWLMASTKTSSPQLRDHHLETDSVRYSTLHCDAVRYSPEESNTATTAFYRPSNKPLRYQTDVSNAVRYTKEAIDAESLPQNILK